MAAPSFEKDLERLEATVAALEEGGLSLDDAIKRFEEGIKLAKRCEKALAEAEKKIEMLTTNADGELEAEPFGEEETEVPTAENGGGANPGRKTRHAPPETDPDIDEDEDDDGDLLF
jgi:exodeoxyribonuclease VII small subunit